jgi:hypothetical protein
MSDLVRDLRQVGVVGKHASNSTGIDVVDQHNAANVGKILGVG